MVDFRYHIVSLVAVFLALAVGIILGAGPLQNSIGNTLSGEVDSLRETNSSLKKVNEDLMKEQKNYTSALTQIAPTILKETLTNQTVALVLFPETPADDVKQLKEQIALTGATISGVYEIQKAWTDAKNSAYRSAFAEQIKTYVSAAKEESNTNKIMALALQQIVHTGLEAEANKTLAELFTAADTVMLKAIEGGKTGSNAVVFLSPDMPDLQPTKEETQNPDTVAQIDYDTKTYAALVNTIGEKMPAVLAGYANSQHDLVTVVRTSGASLSTVEPLNTTLGAMNTALAIAAELKEQKVSYGFADGVDAVVGRRIIATAQAPVPAPESTPAETTPAE